MTAIREDNPDCPASVAAKMTKHSASRMADFYHKKLRKADEVVDGKAGEPAPDAL
jgi:hypothetical protein